MSKNLSEQLRRIKTLMVFSFDDEEVLTEQGITLKSASDQLGITKTNFKKKWSNVKIKDPDSGEEIVIDENQLEMTYSALNRSKTAKQYWSSMPEQDQKQLIIDYYQYCLKNNIKNVQNGIYAGRGRIKIGKSEKEVSPEAPPVNDWTSNLAEAQTELTPAYKFFVRNKAELSEDAKTGIKNSIIETINIIRATPNLIELKEGVDGVPIGLIGFTVEATTSKVPTTFEYNGKQGNDALADARKDAMINYATEILKSQKVYIPAEPTINIIQLGEIGPDWDPTKFTNDYRKTPEGKKDYENTYSSSRKASISIVLQYETKNISPEEKVGTKEIEKIAQWFVSFYDVPYKKKGKDRKRRKSKKIKGKKNAKTKRSSVECFDFGGSHKGWWNSLKF